MAGGVVGRTFARRRGFSPDEWWRLVTGLMVWGMIGGRLIHVMPHANYYLTYPLEIIRPPIEGYSYYGAVLFGIGYAWQFPRRVGKSFWFIADLLALPWLFALLVSRLVWGAPVVKVGAPSWLVLAVDIVYLTVLFVLLAWGAQGQRRTGSYGRLAMIALGVDGLLRLGAGLLFTLFLPATVAGQTINHIARALAFVVGGSIAVLQGGGIRRPVLEETSQPLSRWVGWFHIRSLDRHQDCDSLLKKGIGRLNRMPRREGRSCRHGTISTTWSGRPKGHFFTSNWIRASPSGRCSGRRRRAGTRGGIWSHVYLLKSLDHARQGDHLGITLGPR